MKVLITESQIASILEAYKDSFSVHLDRKNQFNFQSFE